MREAGCAILGGHSVADDEIKFGYAVTGTDPSATRQDQRGRTRRATRWCSPSASAPA